MDRKGELGRGPYQGKGAMESDMEKRGKKKKGGKPQGFGLRMN